MNLRTYIVSIFLFFIQFSQTHAIAETYQWTDADGTIHFSDSTANAPSGARPVLRQGEQNTRTDDNSIQSLPVKKEAKISDASSSHSLTAEERQYFVAMCREAKLTKSEIDKILAQITTHEELSRFMENMMKYVQYYGTPFDISVLTNPPDPNFASPERTWRLYNESLIQGNLEQALKCLTGTEAQAQRQIFNELGREEMMRMGKEMETIEKIKQDTETAKYRIRRTENGKKITYYIQFIKILGNWKIDAL